MGKLTISMVMFNSSAVFAWALWRKIFLPDKAWAERRPPARLARQWKITCHPTSGGSMMYTGHHWPIYLEISIYPLVMTNSLLLKMVIYSEFSH